MAGLGCALVEHLSEGPGEDTQRHHALHRGLELQQLVAGIVLGHVAPPCASECWCSRGVVLVFRSFPLECSVAHIPDGHGMLDVQPEFGGVAERGSKFDRG